MVCMSQTATFPMTFNFETGLRAYFARNNNPKSQNQLVCPFLGHKISAATQVYASCMHACIRIKDQDQRYLHQTYMHQDQQIQIYASYKHNFQIQVKVVLLVYKLYRSRSRFDVGPPNFSLRLEEKRCWSCLGGSLKG